MLQNGPVETLCRIAASALAFVVSFAGAFRARIGALFCRIVASALAFSRVSPELSGLGSAFCLLAD
eukprot:10196062-Alexandrium_andersonii.AAC.1